MKRSGFTMIELIFVIVILGILAAVALPKFIGVSEQATAGKVKAFVGTLNRTVGPALWSESISSGNNGSVLGVNAAAFNAQIETPTGVGDSAGTDLTVPNLPGCTPYAAGTLSDPATNAQLLALNSIATVTIGGDVHTIRCYDGSMNNAPRFVLTRASDSAVLVK